MAESVTAADFQITGLRLYFDNNRPEITVKRNQPVTFFTDINFAGSGLLQGYWEVDGRLIANVSRHVVSGGRVTIEAPESPSLPTFDPGSHIVRFVIINHDSLPLPEAIYFVTAEEYKELLSIKLIYPRDNERISYKYLNFRWTPIDEISTYLIEFTEETKGKSIFSAYTTRADYKLPPPVIKTVFISSRTYSWRIKGLNANGKVTGESPIYKFTFGKGK